MLTTTQQVALAVGVATLGTLFVFGSVADIISNGNALIVTNSTILQLGTGSIGQLLPYSFLIMLVTLGVAGWLLFRARETFASDVATAAASEPDATEPPPPEPPPQERR